MTEAATERLRAILESSYQRFKERLRRRLGSDALATEVLHETWMKIGRMGTAELVQRPESYLFRMALNVASDCRRHEGRRLGPADVESLRHMMDDALDPERIAHARAEIATLKAALSELTPRRREIFLLARVDEMRHEDIARRFGISERMVEKELLAALRHCAERLDRKLVRRFGPGARKPS